MRCSMSNIVLRVGSRIGQISFPYRPELPIIADYDTEGIDNAKNQFLINLLAYLQISSTTHCVRLLNRERTANSTTFE